MAAAAGGIDGWRYPGFRHLMCGMAIEVHPGATRGQFDCSMEWFQPLDPAACPGEGRVVPLWVGLLAPSRLVPDVGLFATKGLRSDVTRWPAPGLTGWTTSGSVS